MDGKIEYLNTDLYLISPEDLTPLLAALRARWIRALGDAATRADDGLWYANCETDEGYHDPEANITAILSAIESLDEAGKAAWAACTRREFNIGYDCGDEPWAFQQGLSAGLLGRMAAVNACLQWTIYPDREPGPYDDEE